MLSSCMIGLRTETKEAVDYMQTAVPGQGVFVVSSPILSRSPFLEHGREIVITA